MHRKGRGIGTTQQVATQANGSSPKQAHRQARKNKDVDGSRRKPSQNNKWMKWMKWIKWTRWQAGRGTPACLPGGSAWAAVPPPPPTYSACVYWPTEQSRLAGTRALAWKTAADPKARGSTAAGPWRAFPPFETHTGPHTASGTSHDQLRLHNTGSKGSSSKGSEWQQGKKCVTCPGPSFG